MIDKANVVVIRVEETPVGVADSKGTVEPLDWEPKEVSVKHKIEDCAN